MDRIGRVSGPASAGRALSAHEQGACEPGTSVIRPVNNPGVIVCRNLPLIYLTIPKCACTTIKNLLYRLETGEVFAQPLAIHKMMRDGLLPDTFVSRGEDYDSF